MKIRTKVFLLLTLLVTMSSLCSAQLAMALKTNRSHYLQYEKIYARVTVRNNSGHAVIFGDNKRLKGKLLFKIIDKKGVSVPALSEASYPMAGVIINAGQHKDFIVPITNFYNLKKCKTYRIYAYIEHNMFEDVYRSKDTTFEVNNGMVIWKRPVGVPEFMLARKKEKIKKRTYKLVALNEGSKKSNYLVIEDRKRIYSVLFLSYALGEEHITHEVDHMSRLHLMIPMSPKVFVYLVVDVNGKIDEETVYKRTKTVPTIVRSPKSGKIYVTGGTHAKKKRDYR
jgi:hypothetical protein